MVFCTTRIIQDLFLLGSQSAYGFDRNIFWTWMLTDQLWMRNPEHQGRRLQHKLLGHFLVIAFYIVKKSQVSNSQYELRSCGQIRNVFCSNLNENVMLFNSSYQKDTKNGQSTYRKYCNAHLFWSKTASSDFIKTQFSDMKQDLMQNRFKTKMELLGEPQNCLFLTYTSLRIIFHENFI